VGVAWGLISTARINDLVLAGAGASDRVDVVAVASRDRARAEAYARERGIGRAHGSYEALLADRDVEAVYISLPNAMHVEWSVRALEAGKHVLIEKPLTRHPEEAERAFDAADRAGRVLSEAFMWRHNPQTARLVELVREGAVGRLALVRGAFGFNVYTARGATDVRLLPELEGGGLMDVGCYCVSAIRLLAGEPLAVHAEQHVDASGVDVALAATLRMPDSVLGQLDCGLAVAERDELEVVGDTGTLFLDDPWHARVPVIELRRDGATERISLTPVDSYRLQLENVSDAIRGRAPLLLGREDAVAQARAIAAIYRSAETGTAVALEAA
jgi:D-xylose 1-dehydrogenase (NADP+, D-xylono-1,5-lactone-forming)